MLNGVRNLESTALGVVVHEPQSAKSAVHSYNRYGDSLLFAPSLLAYTGQLEILNHSVGNLVHPLTAEESFQRAAVAGMQFLGLWSVLPLGPLEELLGELVEFRVYFQLGEACASVEEIHLPLRFSSLGGGLVLKSRRLLDSSTLKRKVIAIDLAPFKNC